MTLSQFVIMESRKLAKKLPLALSLSSDAPARQQEITSQNNNSTLSALILKAFTVRFTLFGNYR